MARGYKRYYADGKKFYWQLEFKGFSVDVEKEGKTRRVRKRKSVKAPPQAKIEGKPEANLWADRLELLCGLAEEGDLEAVRDLVRFGILSVKEAEQITEGYVPRALHKDERELGHCVDQFIRAGHRKVSTNRQYEYVLNRFVNWIGSKTAVSQAITAKNLKKFIEERTKNRPDSSNFKHGQRAVSLDKQVLLSFSNWLMEEGLIVSNPVKKAIKVGKAPKHRPRVYSESEVEQILCSAKKYESIDEEKRPWEMLLRLSLEVGWRWDEFGVAQWKDMIFEDTKNPYLTIRPKMDLGWEPKDYEERVVPILEKTAANLREYKEQYPKICAPDCFLLYKSRKTPKARYSSIPRRRFRAIFRGAGIEWHGFHSFRHTAASRWLRAGLDIREIQELLGHASIGTTHEYLKSIESGWMGSVRKRLEAGLTTSSS